MVRAPLPRTPRSQAASDLSRYEITVAVLAAILYALHLLLPSDQVVTDSQDARPDVAQGAAND